jgi:hypothetical protein
VTGPELKQLREHLGEAIGRPLTPADMAKIVGLPAADGATTIRKWEVTGPGHPARELFRILAMASDRYPILEMFNVFDRHDVPETERPARGRRFASRCATTCVGVLVERGFPG